jgi:hypothetical protein
MLLEGIGNPENVRRVRANGCERREVGVRQGAAEDCSFECRTSVAEGVHDGNGTNSALRSLSLPSRSCHDVIHPPHPILSDE